MIPKNRQKNEADPKHDHLDDAFCEDCGDYCKLRCGRHEDELGEQVIVMPMDICLDYYVAT